MKFVLQKLVKSMPARHLRGRRRGVAFVYMALTMLVLLGVTGLVVDVGQLHMREAQAARAADAAALAGAMTLVKDKTALNDANTSARNYARINGYDPDKPGVVFEGGISTVNPNWYTVAVRRPEPLFFMRLMPGVGSSRVVGAVATAQFLVQTPVDLQLGANDYGKVGPTNLSVFGPQAEYQHGDPYSTIWRDNGITRNPDHVGFNGYNFKLNIPANYAALNDNKTQVSVDIFDPDTWNAGTGGPNGTSDYDEIRPPYSDITQPQSIYTATKFALYKVKNPNDPSQDQLIQEITYRDDQTTNNKWVTPPGFSFDAGPNGLGTGEYRINVLATDGSSENGFELRAGPPLATDENFNPANGTTITATGQIPINFNSNGVTEIKLGVVPDAAAGGTLKIEKFDTDIGSQSVYYRSDPPASNEPPGGWPGRLAANGQWLADDPIQLPQDYKAATWYASYTAGRQDTSLWKMSYDAPGVEGDSGVKLVGGPGKHY